MKMKMNKTFDCVEMKRRGAALLRARLDGMAVEEQVEFWRQRTEALWERQEALRDQQPRDHAV
jgi:hypothetical protein